VKRKIIDFVVICTMLAGVMFMIAGCGEKKKDERTERIVYANILIVNNVQDGTSSGDTKINKQFIKTYEDLMNSKSIKSTIEKIYGNVGDIKVEGINDTDMIRVTYMCGNRTDEECKKLLNDWIKELMLRIDEIYGQKCTIIDEPQISVT